MNIYSIADMTRMVLHRKGWTHQKLADEIGVSAKQVQKLLYVPESKWSRVPKGGPEVERLFLEIYPNPVPAEVRPLSDAVDKIAWLKRNKTKNRFVSRICGRSLARVICQERDIERVL
jgi:isopentenyldiphosphate isomerase